MMEVNKKNLLKVTEFAESVGISLPTAYRILNSGNGPKVIRIGRAIRISAESLEEWIAANEGKQVLG